MDAQRERSDSDTVEVEADTSGTHSCDSSNVHWLK